MQGRPIDKNELYNDGVWHQKSVYFKANNLCCISHHYDWQLQLWLSLVQRYVRYYFSPKRWNDIYIFLLIASPVLLVTLFTTFRVGFAILFCGICYLFFEWYSLHPLRVILMGASVVTGYVFILATRKTWDME
ncbi:hypothetical protein [Yersinia rochesterensis]|uniref:hypothetical protein n=1 Tax=Yersinia rochesterensis TaxID=1604335 RepID=UPI0021BD3C2C|nr:hypothetical protein [Yersinia rochesterensis]